MIPDNKPKTAVQKRMDRPHKLDAAVRGHMKITQFIDRGIATVERSKSK